MSTGKILYFGYGSNLDKEDLAKWCERKSTEYPLRNCRGNAFLPDHKLAFTRYAGSRKGGVLDVVGQVGAIVPGVLFEVEPASLLALDEKEGAPRAYRRKSCIVLMEDGAEVSAFTYEVVVKEPSHQKPSGDYLEIVRRGYNAHGLNPRYLAAAAEEKRKVDPSLFVYGTLKRGFSRHGLLEGATCYACAGSAKGGLYDLGDYPGILLEDGNKSTHGELYLMDDPTQLLPKLDRVEGMTGFGAPGRLFRRVLAKVQCGPGDVLAWAYVAEHVGNAPRLQEGEWTDKHEPRAAVTRKWIAALRQEVSSGKFRQVTMYAPKEWGGADVVVTSRKKEKQVASEFYSPPTWIEYPRAQEASWLMHALRVAFCPYLDYINKYEFYGRLARGLVERTRTAEEVAQGMPLLNMLDIAEDIVLELQLNTFG